MLVLHVTGPKAAALRKAAEHGIIVRDIYEGDDTLTLTAGDGWATRAHHWREVSRAHAFNPAYSHAGDLLDFLTLSDEPIADPKVPPGLHPTGGDQD